MAGKIVKSRDGEWLIEYTESIFPYYRFLFPLDPMQEVDENQFLPHDNKVLFTTRYHRYEMYAWVHDTY